MCGITGFINPPFQKASLALAKRMNRTLAHRGPDDHQEVVLENVALAHHRLAIIDLSSAASQPMFNAKKTLGIVFNGEIYNFREIKNDLVKKGYFFNSNSDTEVILKLYQDCGFECVRKLNGIFAFAIWDAKKKLLFFARDHFGIKPFHYFYKDNFFIFGSEIKAILVHPKVKRELNLAALSQYFTIGFGAIPSPNTIFQNIRKLPPAHFAIFKDSKITLKKYWHLEKTNECYCSFEDAKEKLLALLSASVKEQLVSDVPLGSFLSGGIDSSTIVALMKRYHSEKVKTFSVGFDDPAFDESRYAKTAADYLKTEHYQKKFQVNQLLETLPQVIDKMDEPLADASILPTYLLAKFTRQYVTVALSGDGGDELFAGYPTYLAHKFSNLVNFLPKTLLTSISPILIPLAGRFPFMRHSPNLPAGLKLERFLAGLDKNLGEQYLNFMGPMHFNQKQKLFTSQVHKELKKDPALVFLNKLIRQSRNFDQQKQLQYLDLYSYLSEDCLVKTDRASSFNSLEVRVPFLTPALAEFAFSLPSSYHLQGLRLKNLFKASVGEILPQEIINRPKKGFGIPTHYWLRRELRPLLTKLLEKKRLEKQNIFDTNFVKQILKEHQEQTKDHRMILWNLLIFQLWYERWLN